VIGLDGWPIFGGQPALTTIGEVPCPLNVSWAFFTFPLFSEPLGWGRSFRRTDVFGEGLSTPYGGRSRPKTWLGAALSTWPLIRAHLNTSGVSVRTGAGEGALHIPFVTATYPYGKGVVGPPMDAVWDRNMVT
jgi:hypothetical protein